MWSLDTNRWRRCLAAAGVSGALLIPTIGLAADRHDRDPLACFRDNQGRSVRAGDTVRDWQGREVGWVSASQCGEPTPGKLKVFDSRHARGVVLVDGHDIAEIDRGVTLKLTADQWAQKVGPETRSAGG